MLGTLPPRPRLAIVGSRGARKSNAQVAEVAVCAAMRAGWSVVSGGALGIDAYAHRAALAHGVPQLAVLPCPPDRIYPADHASLFAEVVAQPSCGLLFALRSGEAMRRSVFAGRNRLVLQVCDALFVVEAELGSGSLGTGFSALKRRQRVLVLPQSPGTALLAAHGAQELSLETPVADQEHEIARFLLGQSMQQRASPRAWPEHLEEIACTFAEDPKLPRSIDDFSNPLAALIQLSEALALGLVAEISPGRYLARLGSEGSDVA